MTDTEHAPENIEDISPRKLRGLIKNQNKKTTNELDQKFNESLKFEEELKKNDYFLRIPKDRDNKSMLVDSFKKNQSLRPSTESNLQPVRLTHHQNSVPN